MFNLVGFLKGLLIEDTSDRTKQFALQISPSATTATTTTLVAAQTANRTITLPDESGTIRTTGSSIPVNQLAAMAPNQAVQTDGSGFLTTSATTSTELGYVSGATSNIQAQLNSALLNPMTTLGDMLYENAVPASARLPGNTTATKKFLTQTGNGTISASPGWNTVLNTDINGTITIAQGGTGQITKSAAFDALSPMTTGGDLIYGGASGTGTRLANGTAGQFLKSAGGTSAPVWTSVTETTKQMISATGSGTYTTPAGCSLIKVTVTGGGGGGGGCASAINTAAIGGGGSGASTVIKWISSPLSTYSYTVGAGGSGGAAGNNAGSGGNSSTFGTSLITAAGGQAGGGGATATSGFGGNGATGGGFLASPTGDINLVGGFGSRGYIFSQTAAVSGNGGSSYWSAMAPGRGNVAFTAGAGTAGLNFGGGGSGAMQVSGGGTFAGGNGADGFILVEEFYI